MEYQYDDGGRAAAGFKGEAGDCVTRAIAIATEQPYETVYRDITSMIRDWAYSSRSRAALRQRDAGTSARCGVYTNTAAFKRYMASLGWSWTPTMHIGSGCTVHLRADELPRGRIICALSRHMAAVIDGVLHDTSNCSRGGTRCVYGYWSKD